jgi:hypothetical protein
VLALPAGERLTLRGGQQIAAFWMGPRPVRMQLHRKQSHRKQWRRGSFPDTYHEAPGWTLPVSTQDGLQDAVTVIRAVLLNAAP